MNNITEDTKSYPALQGKFMSHIDKKIFERFISTLPETVRPKILNTYKKDIQERYNGCLKAINKNDIETLEREAHTLKSLFRMLGATSPGEIAFSIEKHCTNSGNPKEIQSQVEELAEIIEAILNELNKIIAHQ